MRSGTSLLVCLVCVTGCQSGPKPEALDAALDRAVATSLAEGPRSAEPLLERTLAEARRAGSRRHEARALGYLGVCYKNLGQYRRALDAHRASLGLKEQLGDELEVAKTLSNIGLVYEALGECRSALPQFDRSLAILTRLANHAIEATVINNRALCFDNLGQYPRAAAEYERSLRLHRAFGNNVGAALALGNLGGQGLLRGRYSEAERYYREALALDEQEGNRRGTVLDLVNLGQAAAGLGRTGEALDVFGKAARMAETAGLAREAADTNRARAETLAILGRYEEAREALALATAAYDRLSLGREQVEARIVSGRLSLELGDLGAADASFGAARETALESDLPALVATATLAAGDADLRRRRPDVAMRRYLDAERRAEALGDFALSAQAATRRADAALQSGHSAAGLDAARQAVTAARRGAARLVEADAQIALGRALMAGGDPAHAHEVFDAAIAIGNDTGATDVQWRAAAGLASAVEAEGRPDEALTFYLRAVSIIESVRERLHGSRDRAGYLDDKRHVYAALVRLLVRLGRTDEAFRVAERLRAAAYLDLLARSALIAEHPDAVRGSSVLLTRLAHLQQRVAARGGEDFQVRRGEDRESLQAELRAAEAAWTDAVDELAPHDPLAAALKREAPAGTFEVQRRLGPGRALIQYVMAERETIVFVITPSRARALTLPVSASALTTRIELLRGLVRDPSNDHWIEPAARLYGELIAPVVLAGWLRGTTTLLIVPHAELNYVPFALLAREPRPGSRLLVDDFAVAVLPSARALLLDRPSPAATERLLAVAPEPSRLPHSQAEVSHVGALFPDHQRILVGGLATERVFKEQASRYAVLHLATHGSFNRANPLLSGLDLTADDTDDGRLRVYEILGMQLHASLVTLSACDTALASGELSDVPAGDEFIGLTRAFLSAGSRSVLASLWEVNDRATPAFMESFYTHARRLGVVAGLAAAQRERWHSGDAVRHPFYWAGFVSVGATSGALTTQSGRPGP